MMAPTLIQHCADAFGRLRAAAPRVHAITSPVAAERTANTLLALGATPTLTVNPDEIAAFVAASDAVLVNLGMLDPLRETAAHGAFDAALTRGKPLVLDPVFINLSDRRGALASALLARSPTVFKANRDEAGLAAQAPADTVTIVTGAEDRVSHHGRTFRIANGHPLARSVTAMGCALGGVVAAMLAVEEDASIASAAALLAYGIAGDLAGQQAAGPGSFAVAFLDQLAMLTPDTLLTYGRIA